MPQTENEVTGWAAALADAEERLRDAQVQVARLKITVRTCKQFVESGEPWPEDIPCVS